MKGYIILTVVSLCIILLVPFTAFGIQPTKATPPTDSASVPQKDAAESSNVFKIRNEKTGEVIEMGEEAFVIAIVSCEMGASSPTEALKAQAVAAYTYYFKQRAAAADGIFANVPDTFFTHGTESGMRERWGENYEKWYAAIKDAVKAVEGQLILYNNEPITACYHAISAGMTESAADVWGGDYPYLVPVNSAGDLTAEGYETTVSFTPEQLKPLLQKADGSFAPADDPATWCGKAVTTDSGFVKSIHIGGTAFKGTAVRTALSLRSACFTVRYADGKFVFTVRGYGHNVGMSQTGAKYMANTGADYKEILSHYYPGTVIA